MGKTKLAIPAISGAIVVLAIAFLVVAVFFLLASTKSTSLKEGDKIPPISVVLYDGSTLTIPGGKPVVVHFWASWCRECLKEVPIWKNADEEEALFVWISYKDAESKALEFLRKWEITFPAGKDPGGKLARLFGVTGVPETYFIKADGTLLRRHIGPLEEEELRRFLHELVGR
ncbi:MAG: redoxin family protein [Anaerolineae bacterium]|nr:redoxin family protein [Anaerolineae bacterium]MDW8102934.1 redoxin family protein [Anaerolineae bacterium]